MLGGWLTLVKVCERLRQVKESETKRETETLPWWSLIGIVFMTSQLGPRGLD